MDVESPCDARLLYVGCKILSRTIEKICEVSNRTQPENNMYEIKKLMLIAIGVQKSQISKPTLLKKLIRLTNHKIKEAENFKVIAKKQVHNSSKLHKDIKDLNHYLKLVRQAVRQVKYHLTTGETLAASEILYSYFQTDAKLIKKGGRQDTIGKKIFVISGVNRMIMTPTVCLENDNDARTLEFIMDEHIDDYGVPLSLAADRGFMSRHNKGWYSLS